MGVWLVKYIGPKKKARTGKMDEPKIDKDLDLSGGNGTPPLKDFIAKYDPKSNLERNIVFIAYLKDELKIEKVNINHIWTCYDDIGGTLPVNLKQSIYDTSSRQSWIN